MPTLKPGDAVQTPLGKGIVCDVRNNGRLLVEIDGRSVVVNTDAIRLVENPKHRKNPTNPTNPRNPRNPRNPGNPKNLRSDEPSAGGGGGEVDLHGLTVEEALARAESAINEALLGDSVELRVIHGRSGGRIRAALHRRLREISAVRAFRIDPRNEGVTIVVF